MTIVRSSGFWLSPELLDQLVPDPPSDLPLLRSFLTEILDSFRRLPI